jgi:HEAT repeat protein
MITIAPQLIVTVLVALWILIGGVLIALSAVHGIRVLRDRRTARLDVQARPLVIRYALAEDEDSSLAETLRGASGGLGDRIDERLLSILETVRGDSRSRIAEMLVARRHPQLLRRRARSRRSTVRARSIRRLGQLALPEDEELVHRALSDPSPVVRTIAVRAIVAWPSGPVVTAVLERLRGTEGIPSLVVVTSLIGQGRSSTGALDAIRAGLSDPHPRVRAACAQALGELTSVVDAGRIGLLLRRDPAPSVQLAAATALARVGRSASVPALLEGSRSPWGPVRTHSVTALLALPREITDEALSEIAARGDSLLAPLLPPAAGQFGG